MSTPEPMPRIYVNMARCRKCGATLVSQRVHDFRACACGNFVDGGREYLRRGGNLEDLEELSQYEHP